MQALKSRRFVSLFTAVTCALALLSSGCRQTQVPATVSASGTIEAEEVVIASEFGGKVKEILVQEGDEVEAGEVLLELDTVLLDAQIGEAESALAGAQANLARVEAGARPGEVQIAEAQLEQTVAARDGAEQTWSDALALRDNPQQLNDQIDQARIQVELAQHQVDQAKAQLQKATIERNAYFGAGDDESKTRYAALDEQVQASQAAVGIAEESLAGARAQLENLLDVLANPIAMDTQVHQAKEQYDRALASVDVAQASLDALLAKPTNEEIAIGNAQVSQAQAAVGMLQVQREKMTLRSPLSGLVSSRSIHIGETASPGDTLMIIANLDQVKLTVYIPENRYGRIQLGQDVDVEVDSFPGQVYHGQVVYIASEAEFTPRNVQTKEERVNTVFAVKVRIPNPDHDLKPGMPADATIMVD
jgi:HlyD family secretion protein